ncbi:MAG: ketoacyl-ACP synthase III [Proteobacteria bacterium]|nr:ketoacyl-ACP synthase III [Pseudomonadota bacterium]
MADVMVSGSVKITGTGMGLPKRIVTNDDLAKMMDTSDEWIRQRSGIETRRWLTDGESPSGFALEAAQMALKAAGREPKDIEFVLVATLSPEQYFPGTCSFLQAKLGLGTTPGLDIRAQCSGFIYGLEVGKALIASGQYNRILLVGVEVQSVALEKANRGRDVAVLFGDGAGAAILERVPESGVGIRRVITKLEGINADKLGVACPGATKLNWIEPKDIEDGTIHPRMDGKFVFKNAVTRMPEIIMDVLAKENLKIEDVDFWLFHQANLRINEHIAQAMGIPPEKVYNNIQKYGNMSAASIPVALNECVQSGKIKKGSLVMMTAFGAGFTWGSALVRM